MDPCIFLEGIDHFFKMKAHNGVVKFLSSEIKCQFGVVTSRQY